MGEGRVDVEESGQVQVRALRSVDIVSSEYGAQPSVCSVVVKIHHYMAQEFLILLICASK